MTSVYSDTKCLLGFLHTLNYHHIGSQVLAEWLNDNPRPNREILDIGCGDGRFTSQCFSLLRMQKPKMVLGIDPCQELLKLYRVAVCRAFEGQVKVRRGTVENVALKTWDVVIVSHSLYATLE